LNERDKRLSGVRSALVRPSALDSSILRPRTSAKNFDYERHPVPATLSDLVEHFWTVAWDLEAGRSYTAQTLPYPSVNLSVTNTEADVTGLTRRCYHRHLHGAGYAVGARFRPGCFRPLVRGPVSELTDRHRSIAEVLGRDTTELARRVAASDHPGVRVALLTDFLVADWPDPDPTAQLVADLVEAIAADRGTTRVAQVAEQAGLTVRSLQRLFAEYVGAGPKWVIQRCRLQDAAARVAAQDDDLDWAALAAELGFADQAHLTRAFTATIGVPPATYARQAQAD
jgi:AraC-like DNA-binding protein